MRSSVGVGTASATCLQAVLASRLEHDPQGRAIGFFDPSTGTHWLTFSEYCAGAEVLASHFGEHGLREGSVCVLVLESDEFAAVAVLAVLLLGAIPLLVAPPWTLRATPALRTTVDSILQKTDAPLLVCERSMAGLQDLTHAHPGTRLLVRPELRPVPERRARVEPRFRTDRSCGDLAFMQLTSGTTGRPRICTWKHESVLAAIDGMVRAMRVGPGDLYVNWTPLYHDMGLANNLLLCLVERIPLVMLHTRAFATQPATWLRALSENEATTTWSPNFGFALAAAKIKDEDLVGVHLAHVRGFWNAAERIHQDTLQTFCERFAPYGVRRDSIKTNYGCAENVGGATFSDPDGAVRVERIAAEALYRENVAHAAGPECHTVHTVVSVGRPHPGVEVFILDPEGSPLEDGRIGQIALRTASRMEGYLEDAEANDRALRGDLLLTGDLGYKRADELFWIGRLDERLNIRGRKVDPSDFENIMLSVPGLRKGCFVAFGVENPGTGTQRAVVLAEVRDEVGRSHEEIHREICNRLLVDFGLHDAEVHLVAPQTLVKTSSGKRRHRLYRQQYLQGDLRRDVVYPPLDAPWGGMP